MEDKGYRLNPFMEGLLKGQYLGSKNAIHDKVVAESEISEISSNLLGDTKEKHETKKYLERTTEDLIVDPRRFCKVFHEHSVMLADLNQSALKVFIWILCELHVNSDRVTIKVADVMAYYNYNTTPPIYNGIKELISKNIIAKAYATNEYFINPKVFFNGVINNALYDYVINKYNVPNDTKIVREFIKKVINGGDVNEYIKK